MTGSPDAAPTPVRALGADTPTKIKVGDRVRVVIEGPVREITNAGRIFFIGDHLRSFTVPSDLASIPGGVVSVEVLTPPAPTWEAGDVVRDIVGSTFARQHESHVKPWRLLAAQAGVETGWREEGPTRPLTLLVRRGKAVTP